MKAKTLDKNSITDALLVNYGIFKAEDLASEIIRQNKLSDLLDLAFSSDMRLSNRAMWIVCHCNDISPEKVKPFYARLIEFLKKDNIHTGAIRSIIRIFSMQDAPEKYQSFLLDKSYSYIANYKMPIAVRVFSISVIYKLSLKYPELLNELKSTLMSLDISNESPGMRSRIKHTLKDIEKHLK